MERSRGISGPADTDREPTDLPAEVEHVGTRLEEGFDRLADHMVRVLRREHRRQLRIIVTFEVFLIVAVAVVAFGAAAA